MNTEEIKQSIAETNEGLPNEWTTGIGEASDSYYDHWYHQDNWQIHVYWDEGNPHTVCLYEVDREAEYEDQQVAEYPTKSNSFEHERDALQWAYGLMEKYQ